MNTHDHHYIYSHNPHLSASSSSPSSSQNVYSDVDPPPSLCIPPAPSNVWPYTLDVQAAASIYSPSTSVAYSAFHHSPVEPSSHSYALAGALQASPKLANTNGRAADLARRSHSTAAPMSAAASAAPVAAEQTRWAYATQAYTQNELPVSRSQQQQQQHAYLQAASASASSAGERMAAGDSHCSQMLPLSGGGPLQTEFGGGGGLPQGVCPSAHGQPFPHPHSQNQAMLMHPAQEAWIAQSTGRMQQTHPRPAATPQPNSGEQLSNIVSPLPRPPAMSLASRPHPGFSLSRNYSLPDASQQQQHQQQPHGHAHSPMGMPAPANGSHGADADFDAEVDEEDDFFDDDDEFEEDDGDDGEGSRSSYAHSSPTPELQYPPGTSGTPADFLRSDAGPGSLVNCMVFDADGGVWPAEGPSAAHLNRQGGGTHSPRARAPPAQFSPRGEGARPATMSSASQGAYDKGKRAQNNAEADRENSQHQTVKVLVQSTTPGEPPKKVKMHQCRICQKLFPRPSGLATHMNSHSGARPFKCPLQLCNKTFAVRSNARRHLRTHGVAVPPASLDKMGGPGRSQAPQPFRVGFDTPVVVDVHDFGRTYVDGGGSGSGGGGSGRTTADGNNAGGSGSAGGGSASTANGKAQRLRWVPQSLASRSNAARLRSLSPSSDMADLDLDAEYDDEGEGEDRGGGRHMRSRNDHGHGHGHMSMSPATSLSTNSPHTPTFRRRPPHDLKIAPVPLQASAPSDPNANPYAKYDERNSYVEAGTYPYHPDQWRCLPGPG